MDEMRPRRCVYCRNADHHLCAFRVCECNCSYNLELKQRANARYHEEGKEK